MQSAVSQSGEWDDFLLGGPYDKVSWWGRWRYMDPGFSEDCLDRGGLKPIYIIGNPGQCAASVECERELEIGVSKEWW